MNVKLISYTKGVETDYETPEELVSYCARVSNPSNQINKETANKLIAYLVKHKHWSPFEMVNMCLEIETTRDIARQILRHRSFSFQEFSQRYADPLVDLHFSVREARLQDPKNRQNSIPLDLENFGKGGNKTQQELLQEKWMSKQTEIIDLATRTYQWAIHNGIAKEVARAVLPEGNTMSRMYMNGTLRSWVHYIELRKENGTQLEHMRIAQECANVISEVFPIKDYI